MNNATSELVEALGARFDLTIEPGRKGGELPDQFTGSFPDYTQVPRHAYHPSKTDFRICGAERGRRLWVIPVSTGSAKWTNSPLVSQRANQAMAEAENLNPHYEGCHDSADCNVITGWVWDMNRPDTPLNVEIFDCDNLLATVTASEYRPDLLRVGKGNGKHGFRCIVPNRLKDGKPHSVRVRVSGSNFELHNTPKEIVCLQNGNCQEEYIPLNLGDYPGVFCLLANKLLNIHDNPYLVIVLRTDVGHYENLRVNLEDNLDYLLSHNLVEEFAFETPSDMLKRLI